MSRSESSPGEESAPSRHVVAAPDEGQRLDVWINDVAGWNSRNRVKEAIKLGGVLVAGKRVKPSHRLRAGDVVTLDAEPPPPEGWLEAEDIPLRVLHEDASLIVLDKPAFMAVHPGAGHRTGTLANALASRFAELSDVSGSDRPGIVHRLDRETSGVMCVVKSNRAHYCVASQFQARTVEKVYLAVVEGVMEFDEYRVDEPIGRHPHQPTKMTVIASGRASSTRFEVVERLDGFTFVRCHPRTGRTHQIRVHLAHLGHPILCDKLYGKRHRISYAEVAHLGPGHPDDRTLLERQALHAASLTLDHPLTGTRTSFAAPLAADVQNVLDALRETRRGSGAGDRRGRRGTS